MNILKKPFGKTIMGKYITNVCTNHETKIVDVDTDENLHKIVDTFIKRKDIYALRLYKSGFD